MKIIEHLTVGQRLLLMMLVFLLPATVMLWLIAATIQKDIDFASYERMGNAYQRPIQRILEAMTPYAWARLDGADTAPAQSKIDKGFEELLAMQARYGDKLQVTPEGLSSRGREAYAPDKLLDRWKKLKSSDDLAVTDLVSLATDIKGLLAHTGDTSNLILDPDLDSYYLMDVTLCALPQTQNRLMSVQFDANDLVKKGALADAEKVKCAVNAAMFSDADRARVAGDIDTVFKEDKNFYGISPTLQTTLAPALERYAGASQALETALNALAQGTALTHDDFIKALEGLNHESFAFWHQGVDELDILLGKRIAFLENKRTVSIALALLALGVAVAVALYVSRTIQRVLKNIMDILSNNALLLAQAGGQMENQAQQVASAAHEQVTSIEKTVAFMEQISSIIKQNEDYAGQSRDNTLKALQTANASKQSTEDLHRATLAADTVLDQMETAMNEIRAASDSIAHILRTIDEIAFQTNILALNAAVEAARAGEAGAGFSVVADEVRKLAHRSASAADETSKLIKTSIEKTETGVDVNNKVSKQLQTIAQRTQEVTATIQKTLDEIKPLEKTMEHLTSAAREQSSGVAELTNSIHTIDRMSKANLTNSEELGKAAQFLKSQHAGLSAALTELETLTGTRHAASSSHPAADSRLQF